MPNKEATIFNVFGMTWPRTCDLPYLRRLLYQYHNIYKYLPLSVYSLYVNIYLYISENKECESMCYVVFQIETQIQLNVIIFFREFIKKIHFFTTQKVECLYSDE